MFKILFLIKSLNKRNQGGSHFLVVLILIEKLFKIILLHLDSFLEEFLEGIDIGCAAHRVANEDH